MAIVVFVGRDTSHHYNLWVTDGIAADTFELTGVNGANTGGLINGALPINADLTAFDGEVLFDGHDTSGAEGLWVSDGQVAGTSELTGIHDANSFGIRSSVIQEFPTIYNMVVLNGEVIFGGIDSSNYVGLWVTNGTAVGTQELTGISGEYSGGLDPTYLTVFNNEVIFAGVDSSGHTGLWETNGTTTQEITNEATTDPFFGPKDLTVFNNEILFESLDASGNQALWVTNGSAVGTQELTGINGADTAAISGSTGNFNPTDLTVCTLSVGVTAINEVLFSAVDSSGVTGLWVTDGIAADTHELTGINGVYTGVGGLHPTDLTAFNGEVLFDGIDSSDHQGLWVTNGTAGGTHELTGINGASTTAFDPSDLTLFNGEVIFSGIDSSGLLSLWLTDGTVPTTQEISGVNGVDSFYGLSPSSITVIPCYCRGTLILTDRGQVPAEDLAIGDRVMTRNGTARPIKWIGHRSYGGRFITGRKDILPVCIKASAIGDGVPRRDLWISPHHAMYLDGVLIEAKDLINGVSIVQVQSVEKVEYFHIELDSHDVIIAEGAPSESFIDDGSRGMFHNAHEYWLLFPDEAARATQYCAPRLDHGYEVEEARRCIALRTHRLRAAGGPRIGPLRGYLDAVGLHRIEGWAQNVDHPEAPVCLDIYAGRELIGQTLANHYREDLKHAGLGSGRHSFAFTPPAESTFDPDTVEIRRSFDDAALGFSPDLRRACRPVTVAAGRFPNVTVHRRAASG